MNYKSKHLKASIPIAPLISLIQIAAIPVIFSEVVVLYIQNALYLFRTIAKKRLRYHRYNNHC
jgi:hypothetical protein